MAKQQETTKQGDERLENVEVALSKTELWIENNQKTLWIILIGLLVAAFVIYGITNYNKKRNETAKNLSYPQEINFETQASQAVDFASYYMENENYATALNGDGCYLKQGNYNQAIEYLKKYTNDDKILSAMALGLIGDCYLELGDQQNAIAYYDKATKKNPNDFTTPMFLVKLGMTHEIMGNNAKALETYKLLKKDFPLSNEAFEISKNIANLEEKMK